MKNEFNFFYEGIVHSSKSELNRALICASFFNHVKVIGHSECEDVKAMKLALENLLNSDKILDCKDAGTTLRFLALRVSREKGTFVLKGSKRLFSRPQIELINILNQLGVFIEINENSMIIKSEGWIIPPNGIVIDRSISSQFASAIVLSSWNLEEDLRIHFIGENVSEGYFELTKKMVVDHGMMIDQLTPNQLLIKKQAKITAQTIVVESDLSSIFALASIAVLCGKAIFKKFPFESKQPDLEFLQIFREMNVTMIQNGEDLIIEKSHHLKAINYNIKNCPDLFPVLSILLAFVDGKSILYGAPHLAFKESNRIKKIAELLHLIHVDAQPTSEGILIMGDNKLSKKLTVMNPIDFDPDHDHRLAFAVALINGQNGHINLLDKSVVNKSFPEFWDLVRI